MTGALGDRRQRARHRLQRQPEGLQGAAGLQGQLPRVDDRSDRRVPRRQRAAHPAGVRSRHRHHDVGARARSKPVYQMMKEAGEPFDPKNYLAAVAGYYSDSKGNMLSMPFNSSTPVFYVNKDAFKKAGLDPDKAPKTWKEFGSRGGQAEGIGPDTASTPPAGRPGCTSRTSAPGTTCRSAPRRTASAAPTPSSRINSPAHVKHVSMLADFAKKGWFTYSGRAQRGRGALLQRRVRHAHLELGARRPTSGATPSSTSRSTSCPTTTTSRARRRTRSSAAPRCG